MSILQNESIFLLLFYIIIFIKHSYQFIYSIPFYLNNHFILLFLITHIKTHFTVSLSHVTFLSFSSFFPLSSPFNFLFFLPTIYLNNEIESYNNGVNIHSYYIIFAYAQYYISTYVGSFLAKLCKSWHFFYFRRTNAIALSNFPTLSSTHQRKPKKKKKKNSH